MARQEAMRLHVPRPVGSSTHGEPWGTVLVSEVDLLSSDECSGDA